MPLYTTMVANALATVGLEPFFLANRHLIEPEEAEQLPIKRWLIVPQWPRPAGKSRALIWPEGLSWCLCWIAIFLAICILRPKVVHFQHPIHWRLDPLPIKLLKIFSVVVWTAHDVLPHDGGRNSAARAKRLYETVNAVLVHSRPAAAEVLNYSNISAVVIDHPVRVIKNKPNRRDARQKLGLDQEQRIVAAIGFIRAYKGYALLADTWERMGIHAPLLLVMGEIIDQSESETVRRLQTSLRTDVRLGYASEEDIINAMAAADLIVLPHAKGSDSGSLHMARALGTPVLSSDTPQLAAVVISSRAGTVLPRDCVLWATALSSALPAKPPPPPSPRDTGASHLNAYISAGLSMK